LLTVGPPNGARGIIYLPTLVYFAAITLQALLDLAAFLLKRLHSWQPISAIPVAVTAALVLLVGFVNVDHYWSWETNPRPRQDRWEYVATSEFPDWVAWVTPAASEKGNVTNLGQWH